MKKAPTNFEARVETRLKNTKEAGKILVVLSKASRSVMTYAQQSIAELNMCATDFAVMEALLHKGPIACKYNWQESSGHQWFNHHCRRQVRAACFRRTFRRARRPPRANGQTNQGRQQGHKSSIRHPRNTPRKSRSFALSKRTNDTD